MLGNGRLEAHCFDGIQRLCHIRGKLRKKVCVKIVLHLSVCGLGEGVKILFCIVLYCMEIVLLGQEGSIELHIGLLYCRCGSITETSS